MSGLKVVPIPILPMGMINAYLLAGDGKHVLVDTGIPRSEERIGRALGQVGAAFKDIDLIVVTHAHGDHAGSAHAVRKLSGAPVLAHEAELPHFEQRKPMTYCPTSRFGRFFLRTGRPTRAYDAFTPDILMNDGENFALTDYGVDGAVITTPGHTEGSLSITLGNRSALVSDLVASGILLGGIAMKDRLRPPPFEDDAHQVALELKRLTEMGIETFFLGHGGPVTAGQVRSYSNKILQGT